MDTTCRRCGLPHPRCTGHNRAGQPCKKWPIKGGRVCTTHGGRAPQTRRHAEGRLAVARWGLDSPSVDPGEALLALLAQSWSRVALYSDLLRQAYDGDPKFPQAFAGAGVAALIGWKYDLTRDGDRLPVEEAIRGLVVLEERERTLCAKIAKDAIAAGIEERRVRLAEAQGAMLISVIQRVLDALGLSEAQRQLVPVVVPAAIREIEGGARLSP